MNVEDLQLFVSIADTGGISRSAQLLDMTPAAASAALKRLEQQLGCELFIRSTRQLRITAPGERFLAHCRTALASLEQARAAIDEPGGEMSGEIRLSVSSDLGRNFVLPWLDQLMELHPKLSLHLSLGDALVDFYMQRVDVALRYGWPEDSSMIALPISSIERVVCASPEYIARYGAPEYPEELEAHNALLYQLGSRTHDQWKFRDNEGHYKIKVVGNRVSNDGEVVHRWALAGKGIAFKSKLDIAADLKAGRLVQLLGNYQQEPTQLYLICPSRAKVTPVVLKLRDYLREQCQLLLE
ncbi:LysR family transcriptional regulator [Dongshaea marina]|uniref:LysR family transcriptional regulator n=1 Tax=Dongshaea marina TaxID=2047966 RepID=UPI000D3E2CE4|nr:LysR family transcriptional regulator [Dongshaea marina]